MLTFFVHKRVQVLSNLVNFKTFGFTKIVPRLPADKFEVVVKKCVNAESALPLWEKVWTYVKFPDELN